MCYVLPPGCAAGKHSIPRQRTSASVSIQLLGSLGLPTPQAWGGKGAVCLCNFLLPQTCNVSRPSEPQSCADESELFSFNVSTTSQKKVQFKNCFSQDLSAYKGFNNTVIIKIQFFFFIEIWSPMYAYPHIQFQSNYLQLQLCSCVNPMLIQESTQPWFSSETSGFSQGR